MKPTIENILNLINQLKALDLTALRSVALTNGWETSFQEYELSDATSDIVHIADLLISAMQKNILDTISAGRRNQLISNLSNIITIVPKITSGENLITSFIQEVDRIRDEVKVLGLEAQINKFPSYAAKLKELNDLIKQNEDLQIKLKDALEAKNQVETELDEIKQIKQDSETALIAINALKDSTSLIAENATTKNVEFENNLIKSNQATSDINTLKGGIEEFHGIIEGKKNQLERTIEGSTKIVTEHIELQTKISDLLLKATANNLFNSFGVRADKLETRIFVWAIALVISLLTLVGIGIWIASNFSTGNVDGWFIFKLFLTAPVIYSVMFFSRQFGNDRKLQEEYAFKSAVSLAIPAYRDELQKIAKQEEGRDENIMIMEKTMNQIFTSPTENLSKNPIQESDALTDLLVRTVQTSIETTANSVKKI